MTEISDSKEYRELIIQCLVENKRDHDLIYKEISEIGKEIASLNISTMIKNIDDLNVKVETIKDRMSGLNVDKLRSQLNLMMVDIESIKIKAGMYGAIAGIASAIPASFALVLAVSSLIGGP